MTVDQQFDRRGRGVGTSIGQLRRELGVTQKELAGVLYLTRSGVAEFEHRVDFLVTGLAAYLQALGVGARVILTVDGTEREYQLTNLVVAEDAH
jgi:transcriptional regulator with XRE-family HTH domain